MDLQSRTPAREPRYVPDLPNNREGPQAREPFKCLNGWRLAKRPSDRQLQDTQKNTLIGPSLLRQRQSMSLNAWCPQSPCRPSSCTMFTSTLTGGNTFFAATGKKPLHLCTQGHFSCVWLCDFADCGLPGFSVRDGGSLGKNTGAYWKILVAIPSRALYFLLP